MAAITSHTETSVLQIGYQSAIQTASSNMRRITQWGDGAPIADAKRVTFPNQSANQRRRLGRPPILGPRAGGSVGFTVPLRGVPSVLNAAATPVAFSNASALPFQLLWRAILGAELAPTAGSAVVGSTGTPVTAIEVTAGQGSRFVIGQILVVVISGTPYPRRVTNISTDTLTISPPLPSGVAPSVADVVRSTYCYYPGERDSTTFTVEHAQVEASGAVTQRRAIGCYGSGEINLPTNEVASIAYSGTSVNHTDPGDLSVGTNPAAELDGDSLVWTPEYRLADTVSTAPDVAEISSVKINVPRSWQIVPGSVVNGIGSVHEVAGRDAPITIDIEGLFDAAWWTAFEASTGYTFFAHTSYGTGTSARIAGFHAGVTRINGTPMVTALGKLYACKFQLTCEVDTTITGANPVLSTAEIRTANLIFYNG